MDKVNQAFQHLYREIEYEGGSPRLYEAAIELRRVIMDRLKEQFICDLLSRAEEIGSFAKDPDATAPSGRDVYTASLLRRAALLLHEEWDGRRLDAKAGDIPL